MSSSARSRKNAKSRLATRQARRPKTLPYDWARFSERPAPPAADRLVSPASELGSLLQRYRADLAAAEGGVRSAAGEARTVAIEQAVLVAQLERALDRLADDMKGAGLVRGHRQLRVIKDQMLDALAKGGITVEDPLGRPVQEVEDRVDVVGWRHGPEFDAEVVAETHEAIVLHQGAVVRTGQVVLGAPEPSLEAEPEPEPAELEAGSEPKLEAGSEAAAQSEAEPDVAGESQSEQSPEGEQA